jgi:hypothetical protein
MQTINLNRKEFAKMLNSCICFMDCNEQIANLSKYICIQPICSNNEIMKNEVYTPAIANDISAMQDSTSAIENDTHAMEDTGSAIANYSHAIDDVISANEKERIANHNTSSAIKYDQLAIENDKPAMENDTPAYAKYVFAGFGTNKTSYSTLKSR